jgi:hypothetical protein
MSQMQKFVPYCQTLRCSAHNLELYSGNIDAVPNRYRHCCDVNVTPLCSSIPTKLFPAHIAPSRVDKVNDALALQTVDMLWLHERVRS